MVAAVETGVAGSSLVSPKGGGMWRYILVRFFLVIPTVFIVVTVVFLLTRITGDPITAAQGGRLTPEQLQERIHAAGYDRPLIIQYFEYIGGVLRGDFGTTITDNRPVIQVLLTYGSATIELAFYALIVAFVIGIPFGLIAAYRRDRPTDAVLRIGAIFAYATPIFFVAILLKLIFS